MHNGIVARRRSRHDQRVRTPLHGGYGAKVSMEYLMPVPRLGILEAQSQRGELQMKVPLAAALCGIALTFSAQPVLADDSKDAFIIRSTSKTPDEVAAAVKAYGEKMKWQNIEPTKVKKDEVTLIKTCIPAVGGKLWPIGLHVAAMLPCGNLAAYKGKDGKTEVSMLKMSYMAKLIADPRIDEAVKVGQPLLDAMIDEITK
jgi:hypothetical protein